jgi:hypothetical protein
MHVCKINNWLHTNNFNLHSNSTDGDKDSVLWRKGECYQDRFPSRWVCRHTAYLTNVSSRLVAGRRCAGVARVVDDHELNRTREKEREAY